MLILQIDEVYHCAHLNVPSKHLSVQLKISPEIATVLLLFVLYGLCSQFLAQKMKPTLVQFMLCYSQRQLILRRLLYGSLCMEMRVSFRLSFQR